MRRPFIFCALAALALTGCTDTQMAHWQAIGSSGRVTCYSGGRIILDDFSTGKIQNAGNSDGYEFKSVTTGRLMQASGQCVVDYGADRPANFKAVLP